VLRLAFNRAMAAWMCSRLGLFTGTSLAATSPWRVMEKLSPLRTLSRSAENLALASEAAIVVFLFMFLCYHFDRS